MAYWKDIDADQQGDQEAEVLPSLDWYATAATAQLICIPFNTPYVFIVPKNDSKGDPIYPVQFSGPSTAASIASTWGFTFFRDTDDKKLKNQYSLVTQDLIVKDVASSVNEETNFNEFAKAGQSTDKLREVFSFFIDKRQGLPTGWYSYTSIKKGGLADWDYIAAALPELESPMSDLFYTAGVGASGYIGIFPTWYPFAPEFFHTLQTNANNANITNETITFETSLLYSRLGQGAGQEDETLDIPQDSFVDATFVLHKPFLEEAYKEAPGAEMGISDPVRIKANYNFYLQQYENIIKNIKLNIMVNKVQQEMPIPERLLPNLYALAIDIGGSNEPNYKFKYADQWQYHNDDISKYIPAIFSRWHAQLSDSSTAWPLANWGEVTTFNEYLNNFARTLDKVSKSPNISSSPLLFGTFGLKYGVTAMSAYQMKDLMGEADNIKKFFPMHVDIEVPPSTHGPIGQILYESNMFDQFMGVIMGALYPRTQLTAGNKAVHISTAIVKKDAYITGADTGSPQLEALEDNLYHEDLRKLWLNDILQTPSLPDLKNVGTAPVYSYFSAGPSGFYKTPPPWSNDSLTWTDNDALLEAITSPRLTTIEPIQILSDKLNLKIGTPVQGATGISGNKPMRPVIFGQKEGSSVKFINNIKWALTTSKINEVIKEKVRSVKEIYEGKSAHSEVLFYEVVKFRSEYPEAGGKYLQSIFLPNTPGMEALKYIDTQVKFDNEYYYQIYAHTLVVGTQYEYIDITPDHKIDDWAVSWGAVRYKLAPSVYLIRTPYYNTYVTMKDAASIPDFVPKLLKALEDGDDVQSILAHENQKPGNLERTPVYDKPPVFPDVNFLPLYAEKDKILLNTNFNVGEYDLKPIFIDEHEDDNLDKIRRNQKRMGTNDKITFRGDDFCGKIQILRTDKKPLSWDSFAPTSNYIIGETGGNAALGFFDDTLQPNKDYYYTVRAKDVHGNFSNPSPIYHVRIVAKEGEAPYTIIKMFFLEEVEDKKPTVRKNLMKYVRIQPSFKQTFLDEKSITTHPNWPSVNQFVAAQDGVGESVQKVIGDETLTKTVFGRKFKIRFTSKKTGRKFDLNLTVDNPYIAPAEGLASAGAPNEYSSGKCE